MDESSGERSARASPSQAAGVQKMRSPPLQEILFQTGKGEPIPLKECTPSKRATEGQIPTIKEQYPLPLSLGALSKDGIVCVVANSCVEWLCSEYALHTAPRELSKYLPSPGASELIFLVLRDLAMVSMTAAASGVGAEGEVALQFAGIHTNTHP